MPMTEQEARQEAEKRNAANRRLAASGKTWRAVHNSVKGWHVSIVDIMPPRADKLPTLADIIQSGKL